MQSLIVLKEEVKRLQKQIIDSCIVSGVNIKTYPKNIICSKCNNQMVVQKTFPRNIVTIKTGHITVRETELGCNTHCKYPSGKLITQRSEDLTRIVAPGKKFGYDVEVYVGMQRYIHHKQREEIQIELLRNHDISISTGKITDLAIRFIDHFEALHISRSQEFKKVLKNDGGYPLHIDATGEAGSGILLVAYSGWRKWVLGAWSLTTECAKQIKPCIDEVASMFGVPCGIMRDLGRAMIPAVAEFSKEQDEKIVILSCHEHFLKDIGKDLLEPSYADLRKCFRSYAIKSNLQTLSRQWGKRLGTKAKKERHNIKKWAECAKLCSIPEGTTGLAILRTLAQLILDYPADSGNLRFPFELPYLDFYERCKTARCAIDRFLATPPEDKYILDSLKRLRKVVDPVLSDSIFFDTVKVLKKRAMLFNELRKCLRLKPKSGKADTKILVTVEERILELRDICQSLEDLKKSLMDRQSKKTTTQDIRKATKLILAHIDRHGDTLFGHVIALPKYVGTKSLLIDRTNNILEFFFNLIKRGERRRSGRKNLNQDMENFPPAAALVQNLLHSDYVEILCGSIGQLPEEFSKIDNRRRLEKLNRSVEEKTYLITKERTETASLSKNDRRFIRNEFPIECIKNIASNRAPMINSANL